MRLANVSKVFLSAACLAVAACPLGAEAAPGLLPQPSDPEPPASEPSIDPCVTQRADATQVVGGPTTGRVFSQDTSYATRPGCKRWLVDGTLNPSSAKAPPGKSPLVVFRIDHVNTPELSIIRKEHCRTYTLDLVVYRKKEGEASFTPYGRKTMRGNWQGQSCNLVLVAGAEMAPVSAPTSGQDVYRLALAHRFMDKDGRALAAFVHPDL